jgi:hypothetical protein
MDEKTKDHERVAALEARIVKLEVSNAALANRLASVERQTFRGGGARSIEEIDARLDRVLVRLSAIEYPLPELILQQDLECLVRGICDRREHDMTRRAERAEHESRAHTARHVEEKLQRRIKNRGEAS